MRDTIDVSSTLMFPMSWQLPHSPLLGRVLLAQLFGAVAAGATAGIVALLVPTTPAYPAKAMLASMAVSVVALGYLKRHHPFDRYGAANLVTTGRAALVAVVAALVGEGGAERVAWTVATLGLAAAALDGVDGWLARRTSMASSFGARFDMEVDALLILVLAVLTWQHGKAGVWIVLAGAMRYLFVFAGFAWRWIEAPLPPSVRRKSVCVVQIVGLAVVVSPLVESPASVALAAIILAALIWSFGVDVLWLRRQRG